MKRQLFIFIGLLLILSPPLLAQSKLDEIRGFKGIKIGDSYSKWEHSLSNKQIQGNEAGYYFSNPCCTEVFDYDIEEIFLIFEFNTLKSIRITTKWFDKPGEWRDTEFMDIKQRLEYFFEPATDYFASKNREGNIIWFWEGKQIYMQSEYDWHGSFKPSRVIISIADKQYLEKQLQRGF